jgi:hypothetical protein
VGCATILVVGYWNDRLNNKIHTVREIKMENFLLKPTFHYSNTPSFHVSGPKTNMAKISKS